MFGLNAVWSEVGKPSPRQQPAGRRSRHAARRPVWPVAMVIIGAVLCAALMIVLLMNT